MLCSVLAFFLPCFVSLQRLHVDSERDADFLSLFLQVWPLRYLTDSQMLEPRQLAWHWVCLTTDFAYERIDVQMLQYFHEQHSDSITLVTAVTCGTHYRFG